MAVPYDKAWWKTQWLRRMKCVEDSFGTFDPPGQVTNFTFPDPRYTIPGACAIRIKRLTPAGDQLTISLGISQPLCAGETANPWEFGVFAPPDAKWPSELLYDLMLGFAEHPGWLEEGHCLPLTFFRDVDGNLNCGSFDSEADGRIVPEGELRSLYLWRDTVLKRSVDLGDNSFFLMIATGITRDEEQAGDETSPPHVLLLLKELGFSQTTDPARPSAFDLPRADKIWQGIRRLDSSEVIRRLSD